MEVHGEKVTRWRSPAPDTIAWAFWDDDYVAYHRPSGRTHFLNVSSRHLIAELLCEPKDAATVAQAFSPPRDDMERQAHLSEITSMLERLEHLGLIDRA